MTAKFWFVLGREGLLSSAELAAFFNSADYELADSVLTLDLPPECVADPAGLMRRLGGTIKLGREIGADLTEAELLAALRAELETVEGKIHFGLSVYGAGGANDRLPQLDRWGKKLKQELKAAGRSVRYVESREPALSSATVEHNGLTKRGREFLVLARPPLHSHFARGRHYALAVTLAVQPFAEFSARDFGRPGRDDASGMLPPKLAMMMINLSQAPRDGVVLDPFCGSGTIVTEAMLLGFENFIGSDISKKAIDDTRKNIEWTKKQFSGTIDVFQSDVRNLHQKLAPASVDAIITEPYLGKPLTGREVKSDLERQAQELKKMYLAAFGEFQKILKPGGRVVFVIPRFKIINNKQLTINNTWITIDCAPEIKKTGFSIVPLLPNHDFLLYARPDQRVGREIWRFEKCAL